MGNGCALRVFDVASGTDNMDTFHVNVCVIPYKGRYDYIDLLAYGSHMYWLQPSQEKTRSRWGLCDIPLGNHIRYSPPLRWALKSPCHPATEQAPRCIPCKRCSVHVKSGSTAEDFYNVAGGSFDKGSISIPEFRMGGKSSQSPIDMPHEDPSLGTLAPDDNELESIGNMRGIRELNCAYGDMYSLSPGASPQNEPQSSLAIAPVPIEHPHNIEHANWEWPMGVPNGKNWRHVEPPEL